MRLVSWRWVTYVDRGMFSYVDRGMFSYVDRGMFSYVDRPKCLFTLHPLADLFIPTPTRLLWEAFSHAAISGWILHIHISTTVYIQVLIYTAGWTGASWRRRKHPTFWDGSKENSSPSSLDLDSSILPKKLNTGKAAKRICCNKRPRLAAV